MSQKQKNLAMDFAVLLTFMCSDDFLPDIDESCQGDMSDMPFENTRAWYDESRRRIDVLQQKSIESHVLGQYFIEKGYTWQEVRDFVMNLQVGKYAETLRVLNEQPK